jgi:hypothetical protein
MPDDVISAQRAIETAVYTANPEQILRALERLRPPAKGRRLVSMLLGLVENAEDARVRNAAAVTLADLQVKRAGPAIKALLNDPRTVGKRGTLLYALHELRATIAAADWARLISEDSAETHEECLLMMEDGLVTGDAADWREAARRLRAALKRRSGQSAAAIEEALALLGEHHA